MGFPAAVSRAVAPCGSDAPIRLRPLWSFGQCGQIRPPGTRPPPHEPDGNAAIWCRDRFCILIPYGGCNEKWIRRPAWFGASVFLGEEPDPPCGVNAPRRKESRLIRFH